jgi:hypothetical protein
MRRKLFTLAAVASAVLCIALCVLWVRSYWYEDYAIRGSASGVRTFRSREGTIVLSINDVPYMHSSWQSGLIDRNRPWGLPSPSSPAPAWEHLYRLGFTHRYSVAAPNANATARFAAIGRPVPPMTHLRYIGVPYWLMVALLGAGPVLRIVASFARRRRQHRGYCRTCGYDLRATPDRCPECGAAAAAKGDRA